MDNLINLISALSKNQNNKPSQETNQPIPKEILDQYPYGEFPIRYTRPGQETIRKNSENRFSYNDIPIKEEQQNNNSSSFDLNSMLPLIQILSNKNHSSKDMFQVLSKLLFKDNPELQSLINLFSKTSSHEIKSQEIDNTELFPNTNKVNIASLPKVKK